MVISPSTGLKDDGSVTRSLPLSLFSTIDVNSSSQSSTLVVYINFVNF